MAKNKHRTESSANQKYKGNAYYLIFLQWSLFWQLHSAATSCKNQGKYLMNLIFKKSNM